MTELRRQKLVYQGRNAIYRAYTCCSECYPLAILAIAEEAKKSVGEWVLKRKKEPIPEYASPHGVSKLLLTEFN